MQAFRCASPAECAQLSQAEADYNRLFNLSPDLLCIAGLDGFFKRVNPSWTRILGWSEAELLSRPVAEFVHPDDRERTLQARSGLAQGVPVRDLENRYLCKDGSFRWLAWQSVIEPGGMTVFAVARDITERRQLEHQHLVRSKLESTGILAGGLAHDFNNLLASLLLNLEMVSLSDPITDRQDHYLRQARETILAARALTEQLITFSDGGMSARSVVDLKDLLRRAVEIGLSGSTLRGECVIDPDLWPAEVDAGQISQVVRNLVLNAREASPPGGTVRLQASNLTPAVADEGGQRDRVRISITDDGAGIPADVLPKIFDPYFSTKQRGAQKGMGLGLTICRTVIHKHGGTIDVESRPGCGTTVVCTLPAVPKTVVETPPSTPTTSLSTARILVMDDETVFREIMAATLRQFGCHVDEAKDGEEAVARYQQARAAARPFDIVLLDLTVRGGMGGREAMAALQRHDPAVKAVLMTGHSNEPIFRDPARYGFKGALGKPFTAVTLRTLLTDVLQMPVIRDDPMI